jgi:hypothetical protein
MVIDEDATSWTIGSDHNFIEVTVAGARRTQTTQTSAKKRWNIKTTTNWEAFRETLDTQLTDWYQQMDNGGAKMTDLAYTKLLEATIEAGLRTVGKTTAKGAMKTNKKLRISAAKRNSALAKWRQAGKRGAANVSELQKEAQDFQRKHMKLQAVEGTRSFIKHQVNSLKGGNLRQCK